MQSEARIIHFIEGKFADLTLHQSYQEKQLREQKCLLRLHAAKLIQQDELIKSQSAELDSLKSSLPSTVCVCPGETISDLDNLDEPVVVVATPDEPEPEFSSMRLRSGRIKQNLSQK